MSGPSRYMRRKFDLDFDEGLEFWSGDDGEPVSFVVKQSDEGLKQLLQKLAEDGINYEPGKVKKRFAYRGNVEEGEWEGVRKIWRTTIESTPFPVFEYEY